jgi:hypothetical protein
MSIRGAGSIAKLLRLRFTRPDMKQPDDESGCVRYESAGRFPGDGGSFGGYFNGVRGGGLYPIRGIRERFHFSLAIRFLFQSEIRDISLRSNCLISLPPLQKKIIDIITIIIRELNIVDCLQPNQKDSVGIGFLRLVLGIIPRHIREIKQAFFHAIRIV